MASSSGERVLPLVLGASILVLLAGLGVPSIRPVEGVARAVPPSAAASAQSLYAALSSGLGSGLVMMIAGTLYSAFGGGAYAFMAALSAAGLVGAVTLGWATDRRNRQRSLRVR
jgi:hypothetical protein